MKHFSLGFAFYRSEVLLILKARPDFQKGKLNGLGGSVEENENSLMAMVAEFLEETGTTIHDYRWLYSGFLIDAILNDVKVDVFHTILTDNEYNNLKYSEMMNIKLSKDEPIKFINIHDEIHYLQNRNILMYNVRDIIYKLSCECAKQNPYFKPMDLTWKYEERLTR